MSDAYFAMGLGVGTQNARSEWLEVFYPTPVLAPSRAAVDAIAGLVGYEGGNAAVSLDPARLRPCNKVLCTSTTILNNSLDEILSYCAPQAFVSIIGPTARRSRNAPLPDSEGSCSGASKAERSNAK